MKKMRPLGTYVGINGKKWQQKKLQEHRLVGRKVIKGEMA